jgi:hypothetical protein
MHLLARLRVNPCPAVVAAYPMACWVLCYMLECPVSTDGLRSIGLPKRFTRPVEPIRCVVGHS